ncbi:MAG: aldo/keto reductase [Bacteriovoracaceae bacterium]|jgi:diketogulonate reductase-like aldo/keto reductase|nr:aldo/keto reductase [Bacteriovoracaceae bacterium]
MDQHILSSTGVKIPKLFYGTAWKEHRTAELVERAIKKGFRAIDTACQPKHYKEPLVGRGIQRAYQLGLKREDLFIQTKFTSIRGQDPNDIPYDPALPLKDQIHNSFEVSKSNLNTDYLDSLVLHSPLETWEDTLVAWQTFEEIYELGEVKLIGLSNCYDPELFASLYHEAKIKPAILQNRFYKETNHDKELRAFCRENDIFYQCFWTLKANLHILESEVVVELASRLDKTSAQIFYRCLYQQGINPIIGTTSANHMDQDLEILNFSISDEDCNRIKEMGPY